MNSLPESEGIDVASLAGTLRNTTNSYKFYWLLAILDQIRKHHESRLSIDSLLAEMVASVWYPVNYFRLSLGTQDKLAEVVTTLMAESGLSSDAAGEEIVGAFEECGPNSVARKAMRGRGRYVPFRFLSPFFEHETRGIPDAKVNQTIRRGAAERFTSHSPAVYRFDAGSIELADPWFRYFLQHQEILRGFCLWHLIRFLQKRNPNVSGLSSKVFRPKLRDLSNAKRFWETAIQQIGSLECIYTQSSIDPNSMSLDHFVPWSFCVHDELWNICPTTVAANSSKGDRLPNLEQYWGHFVELQFRAMRAVLGKTPKQLESYAVLLGTSSNAALAGVAKEEFATKLEDTIHPQIQIARNSGFPANWSYPGAQ